MQKIYIATVAECDEDGSLYNAVFHGTDENTVIGNVNAFFEEEAADGHSVKGASFETAADADGFDAYDEHNANHYRVFVTSTEIPDVEPAPASGNNDVVLKTIRNWANNSCAYLSDKPGYAKGYKDGIMQAKEMVRDMLDCETPVNDGYVDVITSFHDDEKGAWAIDAYIGPDPDADDAGHTVAWIHDDLNVEWVDDSAKDSVLVKEAIFEKIKELKNA